MLPQEETPEQELTDGLYELFAAEAAEETRDVSSLPEFLRKERVRFEAVRPLMHRLDNKLLQSIIDKVDKNSKLPVALENDIFQMYYTPLSSLQLVESEEEWRGTLLTRLFNVYLQGITSNKIFYSTIVTERLVEELVKEMEKQQKQNEQNQEPCPQGMSPTDQVMRQLASNEQQMQQILQRATTAAKKQIEKLQRQMDEFPLQDAGDQQDTDTEPGQMPGDGTASSLADIESIRKVLEQLRNVTINPATMKAFVQLTLRTTTAYFSKQTITTHKPLLDGHPLTQLDNVLFMHPRLRPLIGNVSVAVRKPVMKFDLYLDKSGSMTSRVEGMTRLDLVKLLALTFIKKNLVANVYFFDGGIDPVARTAQAILKVGPAGGTNTEQVVQQIVAQKRPGIILTDMCDQIDTYTAFAYFVGVGHASMYATEAGDQYLARGQFALFNGKTLEIQQ